MSGPTTVSSSPISRPSSASAAGAPPRLPPPPARGSPGGVPSRAGSTVAPRGAGVEERQADRRRIVSEAVLPGCELVGAEAGPAELRARALLERHGVRGSRRGPEMPSSTGAGPDRRATRGPHRRAGPRRRADLAGRGTRANLSAIGRNVPRIVASTAPPPPPPPPPSTRAAPPPPPWIEWLTTRLRRRSLRMLRVVRPCCSQPWPRIAPVRVDTTGPAMYRPPRAGGRWRPSPRTWLATVSGLCLAAVWVSPDFAWVSFAVFVALATTLARASRLPPSWPWRRGPVRSWSVAGPMMGTGLRRSSVRWSVPAAARSSASAARRL